MSTIRVSLVSSVVLALSALAFGSGCAVDADSTGEMPEIATGSETQALNGVVVPAPSSPVTLLPIVAPECRAVLVLTGPPEGAGPNTFGCSDADPYKGQVRISGGIEGATLIKDDAVPGALRCTVPALKSTCTKARDRVIEHLCEETRTYECPCGVATTVVSGETVGFCRAFPQ